MIFIHKKRVEIHSKLIIIYSMHYTSFTRTLLQQEGDIIPVAPVVNGSKCIEPLEIPYVFVMFVIQSFRN